jgi:hypothetical protein
MLAMCIWINGYGTTNPNRLVEILSQLPGSSLGCYANLIQLQRSAKTLRALRDKGTRSHSSGEYWDSVSWYTPELPLIASLGK